MRECSMRSPTGVLRASPYSAKIVHYARVDQQSRGGGLGDPENASAELGKKAFHEAADRLAELIDDLHGRTDRVVEGEPHAALERAGRRS